jgi:hypothetical protein
MKATRLCILIIGLLSCSPSKKDTKTVNSIAKDSLVHIDTLCIDEKINEQAKNNEFQTCSFEKLLKDPKTPKLAKDIINNTAKYSEVPLDYFNQLNSKDTLTKQFYFKVLTNSQKIADGAFAEGLGYKGYEYVEKHTKDFASFFDNKQCFTEQDLSTWVDIVMLEFSLLGDNDSDKSMVDKYLLKLNANCKNCTRNQKETIIKFAVKLRKSWGER